MCANHAHPSTRALIYRAGPNADCVQSVSALCFCSQTSGDSMVSYCTTVERPSGQREWTPRSAPSQCHAETAAASLPHSSEHCRPSRPPASRISGSVRKRGARPACSSRPVRSICFGMAVDYQRLRWRLPQRPSAGTGWRAVIIKQRRRQSDAIAGKIDYKQLILL